MPCPAKSGDVLFFNYLTIHGSGLNESKEARTTLLVQMRDPADPPSFATHQSQGQGMMLHGIDTNCQSTRPLKRVQGPDGRMTDAVVSDGEARETVSGGAMGGNAMGGGMGKM